MPSLLSTTPCSTALVLAMLTLNLGDELSAWVRLIMWGRRYSPMVRVAPTWTMRPSRSAYSRMLSFACSTARSAMTTWSYRILPKTVRVTPRLVREKSCAPYSCSRFWIWTLTLGWLMNRRFDAWVMLPVSATSLNTVNCSIELIEPHFAFSQGGASVPTLQRPGRSSERYAKPTCFSLCLSKER